MDLNFYFMIFDQGLSTAVVLWSRILLWVYLSSSRKKVEQKTFLKQNCIGSSIFSKIPAKNRHSTNWFHKHTSQRSSMFTVWNSQLHGNQCYFSLVVDFKFCIFLKIHLLIVIYYTTMRCLTTKSVWWINVLIKPDLIY